jgi:ketosteroid isomerase-like protein
VTFGEVNHGSGELRKFAASFFEAVPDMHMELMGSSVENGHGTIEWRLSGTDKGVYKTGKKFSIRGASIIEVRGGKISRNLDFYDSAGIMRQVGLLPQEAAK